MSKDLITPIGEAKWPKLIQGDAFGDEKLKYSTTLLLDTDSPECAALIECLEPLVLAAERLHKPTLNPKQLKEYRLHRPWDDDVDTVVDDSTSDKTYVNTGKTGFKFSTYAEDKDGTPRTMRLADADNKLIKNPSFEIWNGSRIRVAYQVTDYYMAATGKIGIKLWLNAVQIVELVDGSSNASTSFDEVEGGYTQPTNTQPQAPVAPDAEGFPTVSDENLDGPTAGSGADF